MVSVQARKDKARYAMQRGLSQRRVCTLFRISRSCFSYASKMPQKDAPIIDAMKLLSAQYPRFGARRIRILLGRMGNYYG
jgi:putative transposase